MDLQTRPDGAEAEVQPTVTLVFGTEDVTIEEEKAFLKEVSSFFEAMFDGGFQERTMETIVIKDFDGKACKLILESLRQGKESGVDLSAQVANIICPEIYQTLMALMIKVDLERLALHTMNMQQIEAYSKLAFDTGNTKLEKFCLWKSLGIFSEFRTTKTFKNMNIQDLITFLTHKYLDCQCETEIIKAVFGWINHDIQGREAHFADALSLIKWKKKVKKNQMEFLLLKSKIVKKSERLRKILFTIYLKVFVAGLTYNLKQIISRSVVGSSESPEVQMANELLSRQVNRERRSIALIIQKDFKIYDTHYSAAFLYDCETMTIKDHIYECREEISFVQEYDIYDYQWYMFGKMRKKPGDQPQPNLIKKRRMSGIDKWTTVGGFGPVYRKLKHVDRTAAEDDLPANSAYRRDLPSTSDGSGSIVASSSRFYFVGRGHASTSRGRDGQGIKRPVEQDPSPAEYQDFPVDVRRSARNFYIFGKTGEVFDTKTKKLKVLWSRGNNYISDVKFPFIYSAHREREQENLEFVLYNLKTDQTIKLINKHQLELQRQLARQQQREQRDQQERNIGINQQQLLHSLAFGVPPPPRPQNVAPNAAPRVRISKVLIGSGLSFITPKDNTYYISEIHETSINDPRRIARDEFQLPEAPIILQHPIMAQFDHYGDIYLVQKDSKQPDNNYYLLSKLVGSGRNERAEVVKEMGDLDKQIKDLLTTHFNESDGEILEISKSIKIKPVNSVWIV